MEILESDENQLTISLPQGCLSSLFNVGLTIFFIVIGIDLITSLSLSRSRLRVIQLNCQKLEAKHINCEVSSQFLGLFSPSEHSFPKVDLVPAIEKDNKRQGLITTINLQNADRQQKITFYGNRYAKKDYQQIKNFLESANPSSLSINKGLNLYFTNTLLQKYDNLFLFFALPLLIGLKLVLVFLEPRKKILTFALSDQTLLVEDCYHFTKRKFSYSLFQLKLIQGKNWYKIVLPDDHLDIFLTNRKQIEEMLAVNVKVQEWFDCAIPEELYQIFTREGIFSYEREKLKIELEETSKSIISQVAHYAVILKTETGEKISLALETDRDRALEIKETIQQAFQSETWQETPYFSDKQIDGHQGKTGEIVVEENTTEEKSGAVIQYTIYLTIDNEKKIRLFETTAHDRALELKQQAETSLNRSFSSS